ncbi:MAG: HAD-IIB family hydrolase [Gammaproteobacteria bacterium]|nr:HAD-IIB family hydrolase [Gammaproteobacteria bacterium]
MLHTALAIDLDGTLLIGDTLPEAECKVLFKAKSMGLEIIIATARWLDLAKPITDKLNLTSPIITCSGAQVYDPLTCQDLADHRLPSDIAELIYPLIDSHDCIATVTYDSHTVLTGLPEPANIKDIGPVKWVTNLSQATKQPARMITVQGTQALDSIRSTLAAETERVSVADSIGPSGQSILTITAAKANKGLALITTCDHLGLDPEQVIAFGDTDGDLDMFAAAGTSVAMGQASKRVQDAATYITSPNTQNGVARFLNTLFDSQEQ